MTLQLRQHDANETPVNGVVPKGVQFLLFELPIICGVVSIIN